MGLWGKYLLFEGVFCGGLILNLIACTPAKPTTTTEASCSKRVSPVYSGATEPSYCSTTYSHSTAVTITGTATFQTRPYTANSGLGAISVGQAIRYAEISVTDSAGQVVQCGETDGSGNFSLQLPTSSETFTVRVMARADNSQLKASVLNCPEENVPYSIEGTVVPDSAKSMGTISASAANSGSLVGAAFNIYDQILRANIFLRAQVGACGFAGCTNFTVAPKVRAYWAKGFNPNAYFNSNGGLSFYLPGYHRLFILGGINGDIYNSDTDHFDNSVIVHEYGHFLEDVYTDTDSPGGSHSGNAVIDPRLAWGEGWGNFIQAAVRNEARYRDTDGTPNAANPTSTSSYIFNIPLEAPAIGCIGSPQDPGCDVPEFNYEGNFREFSITRMLWDVFDDGTNPDSTGDESINNDFNEIWASLTANFGFLNPNAAFRNVGFLNDVQANRLTGSSDWSSLQTMHEGGDTLEYARYVDNTGGCGKVFSMDPYDAPNDNGSFATSHLLRNNDFLFYKHSGGALTLTLIALTTNASGSYATELEPDFDLYLYNTTARFGNSADIVGASEEYWDNDPATPQTETLTVANLAAGNYLINVKAFTGRYQVDNNSGTNNCIGSGFRRICENDPAPDYNFIPAGDDVTYEIEANGVDLCPAALP